MAERAISPSQVSTFLDCPRKWGLRYLDGIEPEPHPSAQLGTDAHKCLENYFKTGHPPVRDSLAAEVAGATLLHWPDPRKVTVESERAISLEFQGITFHGLQDAGWWEGEEYWVGDLKTTGDLRYVKTQEELRQDPQTLIYGLAACHRENVPLVNTRWVYSRTSKGRKTEVVSLRLQKEELEAGMVEHIVPVASLIKQARGKKAEELPQDPEACPKYGGCWFGKNGHCLVSVEAKLKGLFTMASLKDRLAEQKKKNETTIAKANEVAPIEPEESPGLNPPPPPQALGAGGLQAKLSALLGPPKPTKIEFNPAVTTKPPPVPLQEFHGKRDGETPVQAPKNPDPKPSPSHPREFHGKRDGETPVSGTPLFQRGKEAFEAYRAFRGGKNHDGTPTPEWGALTKEIQQAWERSTEPARNAPVLCIGCIPDGHFVDLGVELATLHREFCKLSGVQDYRLVDYGKGAGAFLAFFEERWGQKTLAGYYYADPKDPLVALVLGSFKGRMDTVIRSAW